ncbi:MAG: TonB-dependent receptor [Gammaproteobacteria bacterium]
MHKTAIVGLTSFILTSFSATAFAQDESRLEEVVVTARKTEESLQSVPLSITALTSQTLERATVQAISDVSNLTPGLIFQDFNVGALSTPVIRGLAQSNTQGRENNVGVFLDGVYIPSRNNLDLELLDLQRVEIVKGPQSALYGRSTFAGAINYVTNDPSDETDIGFYVSAGSDEYFDANVNLSGALSDTFSATAAFGIREFDGTINNAASDNNLGGYDNTSGLVTLLWEPNEQWSARFMGYFTDRTTESAGIHNVDPNCGSSSPSFFPPPGNPGGDPTYTCGSLPFETDISANPLARGGESDNTILALTVSYDADSYRLTSVTSVTDAGFNSVTDYDADANGVAYFITDAAGPPSFTNLNNLFFNASQDETISQEFRLDGGNDKFSWLTGAYWTSEDSNSSSSLTLDSSPLSATQSIVPGFLGAFLTPNPLVPNVQANIATADVEIWALFARLGWNVSDRSRWSFEGRYTEEDKAVNGVASFFGAPSGPQANTWSYFAPRVTFDYELSDSTLLYASAAQGIKSGGFNTSFSTAFPDEQFFDEESNTTIEFGAKGMLANNRIRYDLAVFFVDWEDLQINGASEDPAFINAIVRNSGSATSQGLELQVDAYINESFDMGFGFAYADPEFDSGVIDRAITALCGDGTLCTNSVGGQQVGRTVKTQFNLYGNFHRDLANDWRWYARADYIYRDESPTRSANLQFIDSWSIVNARVGFANEKWDVAFWAKNLFDEEYVTSQIRQPRLNDFVSPTTVILGNTQQLALTVSYRH